MKKKFLEHLLNFRLDPAIDLICACAAVAISVAITIALNLPGTVNPVRASFAGSLIGTTAFFPFSAFLKSFK